MLLDRSTLKRLAAQASPKPPPKKRAVRASRPPRVHYEGEPVTIVLDIPPQPKQRPRLGKGRVYTPAATRAFEAALGLAARRAMGNRAPFSCPCEVEAIFAIKGEPGTWAVFQKDSDLDNHVKAVGDAFNGIVFTDDRLVVRISATKVCAAVPSVRLTVRPAAP